MSKASGPSNDLPFSSERPGRVGAYHGREEPRAQPAASRHRYTFERTRVAFDCCNGRFGSSPQQEPDVGIVGEDLLHHIKERLTLASLSQRQP